MKDEGCKQVSLPPSILHPFFRLFASLTTFRLRFRTELRLDLEDPAVEQLVEDAQHDGRVIVRAAGDEVVVELIEIDSAPRFTRLMPERYGSVSGDMWRMTRLRWKS